MPTTFSTEYQECETLTLYADLWLEYPGESKLKAEIDGHKKNCEICRKNALVIQAWREWRAVNGKPVPTILAGQDMIMWEAG